MLLKSLWHLNESISSIREKEVRVQDLSKLTIKSNYSLISTGTERLVARGEVPKSLYEVMRVANMEGHFTFPLKYGYSLVGEIISEGEWKGKRVHLMHPHQNIVWANPADVTIIPDTIPSKRATLASNVETAVNALWDSKVGVGDKVLVVGFGMIGSLVARLLSLMPAVKVVVLEKDVYRQQQAARMGFSLLTTTSADFDISFHTSASSAGLQQAIDAVGKEGTIVELSWYGTKKSTLSLGGTFHYQRKRIISSQVGQIPTDRNHRWTYQRRKAVVLQLLENPLFDEHISHEIRLEDAPLFFEKLRAGGMQEGLGWVIGY